MGGPRKPTAYGYGRHVGEVGERRDFALTVDGAPRRFEREWGEGFVYRFRDDDRNVLVWMTGEDRGLDPGKRYLARATVKKHGEWQGTRETHLTRVTVAGEKSKEDEPLPEWLAEAAGTKWLWDRTCGCGHRVGEHERVVTKVMAIFEACYACDCGLFRPRGGAIAR